MFEKPHLFSHDTGYRVFVLAKDADRLVKLLKSAGIDGKAESGTFGYEDLNEDIGREEVASVAVSGADKLALRKVLRNW